MKLLGLTGGMFCGKSCAAKFFQEFGFYCIDADQISKKIVSKGTPALKKITEFFGLSVLNPDGELDRKKMASIVFNDREKLNALNQIMLPRIHDKFLSELQSLKDKKWVLYDAPLLFEHKAADLVERVAVVHCSDEKIRERAAQKGAKFNYEEILRRQKFQMPIQEKLKLGDYSIENNSGSEELKKKVFEVAEKFVSE